MTVATTGSALRQLADRYGIIAEYLDQTGTERRRTSDETRVLLLAAMGVDASTEDAAARALEALDARREREMLPAARVVVAGTAPLEASLLLGAGDWGDSVEWAMELAEESGRVRRESGILPAGAAPGRVAVPIPWGLEPGYHALRLDLHGARETRSARQSLIVVPASCPTPTSRLRGRRVHGITANLYTVRSARNWGIGDTGDLEALVRWAGTIGADFVGVNPLHALRNRGADVSPYSPVSRLFRNVAYLDVERIPELARDPDARAMLDEPAARRALAGLRAAGAVDYERVMALKRPILERLHARFRAARDDADDAAGAARARDYDAWVERQGEALRDFATFLALEEAMADEQPEAGWWREWPAGYRDARSAAVEEFRARHAVRVDFHRWLQFELDRQLGEVAEAAREAGLAIGLYEDLAIGTAPNGSDAWSFDHLFARGASVGAPPDVFQKDGQNWGLPPIDPHKLAADGYRYWIRLVRSALGHAGALRMDHVMGLFRQFWIPEGKTGHDGAYVRFPSDDLLGILALEATRAGALVVGEDLGTVPEDVPPALERWGVLSSKVLYFERDERGFKPAASYAARALATANTHDLPTIAGFWEGRDISLAAELGVADEEETRRRERERAEERDALLRLLRDEGIVGADEVPEGAALRGAVHDFLARTPSALVGLSLDDIVGETEPVNAPGVSSDRFPSWTRRLRLPLEALAADEEVRRSLGEAVAAGRRPPAERGRRG